MYIESKINKILYSLGRRNMVLLLRPAYAVLTFRRAFYTTYIICMICGVRDMIAATGPSNGILPVVINTGAFFATFTQSSVQVSTHVW